MNARVFERHEPILRVDRLASLRVCLSRGNQSARFEAETVPTKLLDSRFRQRAIFVRGSGVLAQRSRNVPSRRLNGRFWNQSSEISLSGSGLFRDRNGSRAWTEAVEPRVRRARASFPRASALVRPRPTRFVLLASIVCADLLVVSDTWTRQLETCSASLPPPLAFAPR